MKHARAIVLLSVALSSLAAAPREDPTYSLIWKPTLGQTLQQTFKLNIDAGEDKVEISGDQEDKVTKVETNGNYTVETRRKSGKVVTNGETHEVPDDEEAEVNEYNPRGQKIEKKDDEEEGPSDDLKALMDITDFVSPENPVKKGDKWTRKVKADDKKHVKAGEYEYEVKGEEKVGAVDVVKVEMKYRDTEDAKPNTMTSSLFFDLKDMSVAKVEAAISFTRAEDGVVGSIKIEMSRK